VTIADLARILAALGFGDERCGFVGPDAVKVFCPSCQPHGPRHAGDEPHCVIAIGTNGPEVRHQ
jgi:hypothetical protein